MVEIASRRSEGAAAPGRPAHEPLRVSRRRSLPGSRAVVGGLLVAAAAVGTFGAYTAASAGPAEHYLALTRDVDAGERLAPGDVVSVPAQLEDAQRATVLRDPAVAVGAVAVGPLAEGQLLAASDLVKLDGVAGRAQISIPVEPSRANNGQLRRGELVDVIATSTSAGATATSTVASDAVVVRVYTGAESLGSSSTAVVTLSVPEAVVEPLADAAAGATITLARVSGLDRSPPAVVLDGVARPAPDRPVEGEDD